MPCINEIFMMALCNALGRTDYMIKTLIWAMDTNKDMNNALSVKILRDLIKADAELRNVLATLDPNVDSSPDFDTDLVNKLLAN